MAEKLIVIGAGPGGYTAAAHGAAMGFETILVESGELGGTCLNYGCIPSKILRRSTQLFGEMKRADAFGITVSGSLSLNMEKVQSRKEKILATQRKGVAGLMRNNGVTVIQGQGTIKSPSEIHVARANGEEETLSFDRLIIATGTTPASIPAFPFDGKRILSSDDVLDFKELPESVVIAGGGVIGCEFAFILREAGVQVTIVEALSRVLSIPGFDPNGSRLIERSMKKQKIRCLTRKTVSAVAVSEDGCSVTVSPVTDTAGKVQKEEILNATKVIVVVGRTPTTAGLGLENAGIQVDNHRFIRVNKRLETSAKGIYAIGDTAGFGKPMLAHVATHDALVAADNAAGGNRTVSYDAVPSAVFTSPESAWVGMTEDEALQAGLPAKSETLLFRILGKVQVLGELDGQARITVNADDGTILGVQLVGPHATELIAEGTLAVQNRLTARQLANTIHAHPTVSEVMFEIAMKSRGKGLHR